MVKQYWRKVVVFVNGSYAEFKKVTWPTKDQTIRLTTYVLGVSLGVALFVWIIDLGLKELLEKVLVR